MHADQAHCLAHVDGLARSVFCDQVRRGEIESEKVIEIEKADDLKP
jgi:hypothetical protein